MKKLLLSLFCLAGLGLAANANTLTWEPKSEGYSNAQEVTQVDKGDIVFEFAKGTNSTNGPKYYDTGEAIRLYAGNTMTISIKDGSITGLSITTDKTDNLNNPTIKVDGANSTLSYDENTLYTWEGTGTEIVITREGTKGHAKISKVEVTYETNGVSKSAAGLAWSESNVTVEKGAEFTAPTLSKETTATVTFESDNEEVATVSADGVITLAGGVGTAVITATAEENDEYYGGTASCTINVIEYNVYVPASSFEAGKSYLLVAKRDESTYYAMPLAESYNYGYLSTKKLEGDVEEISIESIYDDTFKFENAGDDTYYILDCYDRYMCQSGKYKSFQLSTEEPETGWTVTANEDGTYKIEMNGYYVQFGEGTYTSFGIYTTAQENAVMPMLYTLKEPESTGIEAVAADSEAPVVYYNLQGVRVSNPACGIFVRVQGNTATKVLVK